MATDRSDQIATNAVSPASVTADGVSVSQHSIADQIAADRYAKANVAVTRRHRGLRFSRIRPPGSA